jgi:hypothetical protein
MNLRIPFTLDAVIKHCSCNISSHCSEPFTWSTVVMPVVGRRDSESFSHHCTWKPAGKRMVRCDRLLNAESVRKCPDQNVVGVTSRYSSRPPFQVQLCPCAPQLLIINLFRYVNESSPQKMTSGGLM